MAWYDEAVFYHIYPLGLTGAPERNDYGQPSDRLKKLYPWVDHIKTMGFTGLYIGPLFESASHGYDTTDYRKTDSRLGTNDDLRQFVKYCHDAGIRVILDGVFNHTGRDFFAFRDLKENREHSAYRDWYCNVNFRGNNEFNDGFSYDNWGGHNMLAKLNLRNPAVKDYLMETVRFWTEYFDIDGLRLDAADVLDFGFMRELRSFVMNLKADFWLMGEVIHGEYHRWANENTLNSVTNYHLHKALFSGHNDHNYFEIAHTVKRQMDMGIGHGISLYNFADNHDVERIYTKLNDKGHFLPVHVLLYTLPGIPSIYYGSEFAIEGKKERGSDASLRPCIDLREMINTRADYMRLITKLGQIHAAYPDLCHGNYRELQLTTTKFAFARNDIIITVNNENKPAGFELGVDGEYTGSLSGQKITAENGKLNIQLEGNGAEIWVPAGKYKEIPFISEEAFMAEKKVKEKEVAVEVIEKDDTKEEAAVKAEPKKTAKTKTAAKKEPAAKAKPEKTEADKAKPKKTTKAKTGSTKKTAEKAASDKEEIIDTEAKAVTIAESADVLQPADPEGTRVEPSETAEAAEPEVTAEPEAAEPETVPEPEKPLAITAQIHPELTTQLPQPRRSVAFIGSECYPFVKTGGLGDVMYALPKALINQNCDVKVILPRYKCIPWKYQEKMVYRGDFMMDLCIDGRQFYVGIMEYVWDGVVYDFIDNEEFFSSGNPYTNLIDDIPKFCFFSKAALAALNYMNWIPDVIHCHDWQAALVPVYLRTLFADTPLSNSSVMLTIHNLRFQGVYNIPTIRYWTGLPDYVFNKDAMKQGYEDANMLKGGITYSNMVTTVSNTYAGEIQTSFYGDGLDAHLRYHSGKLRGIINGIDYATWDSSTDNMIAAQYDITNVLQKKKENKKALQEQLGLRQDDHMMVIGLISRLTDQKGLDLVNAILPSLLDGHTQIVILGTGDYYYENSFRYYENVNKVIVCSNIMYDEGRAHAIYAGADALLVPSLFEPCGLTQLTAMHYGTIPIVRETGGLKDTVQPYNQFTHEGNGFTFDRYDSGLLYDAINRAKTVYFTDRWHWDEMVQRDMDKDVSWDNSAKQYRNLYLELKP